MSDITLSIDFGTSNTAAAFCGRDGQAHRLQLSLSGLTMPSAVLYQPGQILVGTVAQQARLTAPEAYEDSPKRRLADGTVLLGDWKVSATDLVGAVLAEVLRKALAKLDGLTARLVEAVDASGLPEHANPDRINDWLVATHLDWWRQNGLM